MFYFYTLFSLVVLSTSVFAMERKKETDRKNSDYSSYNPRKELYEQCTPPNKTVADRGSNSDNDKQNSDQKK